MITLLLKDGYRHLSDWFIIIIEGCEIEMSGPALRQADSHSSIHEAAMGEAEQLTQLLRTCLAKEVFEEAYETACIALEHWESRTLAHAQAEEEGLYREIAESRPEWQEKIVALTRDHELMRQLAEEIRQTLAEDVVDDGVVRRFEAMIPIDLLHNREEERMVAIVFEGGFKDE